MGSCETSLFKGHEKHQHCTKCAKMVAPDAEQCPRCGNKDEGWKGCKRCWAYAATGKPCRECHNRRKTARKPEPKTSGDGVRIQNAEISELNGWYKKDDGCYIVWSESTFSDKCGWILRDASGKNRYIKSCSRGCPPTGGFSQQWNFCFPERRESKLIARSS